MASNIQILVQQFLQSGKPYQVMGALNGKLAYTIAKAEQPDLILTDWEMPEMSGLELIQQLKADTDTKNIPILMVSGMRTGAADLQMALEAGAVDFLRKPVHKIELWARVANTLELAEANNLQRQANQKLRELDRLKSRFFTNISHEFRTPLTIISGMADLLLKDQKKWAIKAGNIIQRNNQILLNLINQILDLRKLESGKSALELIQSDVITYLHYIIESFQSLAERKNIELFFQHDESEAILDYDPNKLLWIISNLLSNAIKFTPMGGHIFVEVSLAKTEMKSYLIIQVKDTGIGISASELPYIFDRFYKVNDEAYQQPGTGIGLALSKELIKLMNGKIEVESQVNQGSVFTLKIPISREATIVVERDAISYQTIDKRVQIMNLLPLEPQPSSSLPAYTLPQLPSLLIVEDSEEVGQYLITCLEDHFQLEWAKDGHEGIEKAIDQVPDIILSDVMMPRKNGFVLCQTLKLDQRTSHIPIVLLTAKADMESRIEGLERGADAYLAKPFNEKELLVSLQKLIEIRRRLQERYSSLEIPQTSEDPALQAEDAFMGSVRKAVEQHIDDENFGAPELARALGMSRSSLYAKLKALTDRSPALLIRSIRLSRAKALLQNTDLNITQVAFEVGFHNLSYFSRCFSQEFGITPKQFRH